MIDVTTSPGPPNVGFQILRYYTGSNLDYVCYAFSSQGRDQKITVSTISNASPAVVAATAHGFDYESKVTTTPTVTISGATGAWAYINGTWIATPASADTFTIPIDTSAFGTLTGTVVITTRAPLINKNVWAIQKNVYDGSNNLIFTGWANNPGGLANFAPTGGTTGMNFASASRTTYSYQ